MLRLPVHPHIRLVYYSRGTAAVARNGPSPHTWGLLLGQAQFLAAGRSIPTYVGFTLWIRSARLCFSGPSPHTWGLLIDLIYQLLHVRSIPTYVGFTDHAADNMAVVNGPSPHTWGLRPAAPAAAPAFSVHPHIRGVYNSRRLLSCSRYGPSPHTWGLPSHAQNRSMSRPVHPHIRGVYFGEEKRIPHIRGPSPHTWGLRAARMARMKALRSIPTYVGFTPSSPSTERSTTVHPHIRGVYRISSASV